VIALIELTRSLARAYRTVLRRSLMDQGQRHSWPLLLCKADDGGLTLQSVQSEMALCFHQPSPRTLELIAFRAHVLAEFEGRTDAGVLVEHVAEGKGRARWDDAGVPRVLDIDTVTPDSVPMFPEVPADLTPMPAGFLTVLDEACRTVGKEQGGRFALTRIQLRGRRGDVVATDGRQLLVQAGFRLPWNDDILIPRTSVFACREFACDDQVLLGRSKTHVAVRCGPWTLLLEIDPKSRFPDTQAVIPRSVSIAARLTLDDRDAALLTSVLPKLPGVRDFSAPVTLDVGRRIAIRARAEGSDQVTEVPLVHSTATGPPMLLHLDRRLLHRAVAMGFRELEAVDADTPVMFRDRRRTFLWVLLDKKNAIPAGADVIRVDPADGTAAPPATPPLTRKEMEMPPPNNGQHPQQDRLRDQPLEKWDIEDIIAETEELRSVIQDAGARTIRLLAALKHHRRRSRAVQQAMHSLQQLRLGP
jgi:hypothetical protein